jgi:hypothetical protein
MTDCCRSESHPTAFWRRRDVHGLSPYAYQPRVPLLPARSRSNSDSVAKMPNQAPRRTCRVDPAGEHLQADAAFPTSSITTGRSDRASRPPAVRHQRDASCRPSRPNSPLAEVLRYHQRRAHGRSPQSSRSDPATTRPAGEVAPPASTAVDPQVQAFRSPFHSVDVHAEFTSDRPDRPNWIRPQLCAYVGDDDERIQGLETDRGDPCGARSLARYI